MIFYLSGEFIETYVLQAEEAVNHLIGFIPISLRSSESLSSIPVNDCIFPLKNSVAE